MSSIIADLIKEIPLSAVLKEKILGLDAKLAESETEITLLKGDLRKANVQIEQLRDENKRLTDQINFAAQKTPVLHEIAHKILDLCAAAEIIDGIYERDILTDIHADMHADAMTVKYHIQELQKAGLIKGAGHDWREGAAFALTQDGRKYLLDKNSN